MRRRCFVSSRSLRSVRTLPSNETRPLLGRSRPTISFRATVLPQPLSPTITRVCPRFTVKLMPRNTDCAPNSTLTLSNSTSGAFGIGVSAVIRFSPEFRRLRRRARLTWMTIPMVRASATPQAAGKLHQSQRIPAVVGALQEQRQEEIEHEDGHERQHEGLGR